MVTAMTADYQCPLMDSDAPGVPAQRCLMPAGHDGDCISDAQDTLIALRVAYDDSVYLDSDPGAAWQRLEDHMRWLRGQGLAADVARYRERVSEAADACGH
jgi:hypothetical protein